MDANYEFTFVDKPDDSIWEAIGGGIRDYNTEKVGDDHGKSLCFVVRAPDQQVVGGLIGATYWDWLFVDLLWVREDLRGRGFGQRLMALAEEEARKRGARHAYLDTFTFQAPDFYKKLGYQVFGELHDFPAGHKRFFLQKEL